MNKTDFAWAAVLGLEVKLNKGLFLDFGGRYMDLGSVDIKNKVTGAKEDFKMESWGGYAGLRFEY